MCHPERVPSGFAGPVAKEKGVIPVYAAVVAAVLGKRRRCPACGKVQVVGRMDKNGRYHCKECGHAFTKEDLKSPPRDG